MELDKIKTLTPRKVFTLGAQEILRRCDAFTIEHRERWAAR